MEIVLRPIQQDLVMDQENYKTLQKSVALFPEIRYDHEKELDDKIWRDMYENKNRICYVIEKMPGHLYCGECAVKNINADIPEIEIELMKEYQSQGVGYQSLVMMLNKLAEECGKETFCAKIEPDNYISQLLVEKLGGIPERIEEDYKLAEERREKFAREHRELLDERIGEIAEKFGVDAELLLTHVLVYRIHISDMNLRKEHVMDSAGEREELDLSRKISREKFMDSMKENLESLESILVTVQEGGNLKEELEKMEKKLLDRLRRMGVTM